MACCVFTAFLMNRIIKACEALDIQVLQIQYNDSEEKEVSATSADPKWFLHTKYLALSCMTCAACVQTIEKALLSVDGVQRCSVSLPLQRATVLYDHSIVGVELLIKKIDDVGYGARLYERTAEQNVDLLQQGEELKSLRISFTSALFVASLIAGIDSLRFLSLFQSDLMDVLAVSINFGLASWVQFRDAAFIHESAWAQGRKGLATMDTLLSLSLLLAYLLSIFNIAVNGFAEGQTYLTSSSSLAVVLTGARYVHVLMSRSNAEFLVKLFRLQAESAMVMVKSSRAYVPAVLLQQGDQIIIEQDSLVPCDCFIENSTSTIDESSITGEATPIEKTTGDFIFSGSRNISRPLTAVVNKGQHESSLMKLVDEISFATDQKIEGQQKINVMVSFFVMAVLLLAALASFRSFVAPRATLVGRINIALEKAMTILAASCPCGFGLAVPSAMMAGIDAAWIRGMLITSDAQTMERLAEVTYMVLDKTGTLTEGRLRVSSAYLADDAPPKDASCRLLAAAEVSHAQEHPAAKAVFQWALQNLAQDRRNFQETVNVRVRESILGRGVRCEIETEGGRSYVVHVGSRRFMEENAVDISSFKKETRTTGSKSIVYFAFDEECAGFLILQDTVRTEAASVINSLKSQGLELSMLTGDAAAEAERISTALDIPVLAARSLPQQKKEWIRSLQAQGHKVAMVGDGINDSLAQSAADVGILLSINEMSMTSAADIVFMSKDLRSLPVLFLIAKSVIAQAKLNVLWAIVYNLLVLSLAMGLLEPWGLTITASMAGTLMAFSSVTVLGMSLQLAQRLKHLNDISQKQQEGRDSSKISCPINSAVSTIAARVQ